MTHKNRSLPLTLGRLLRMGLVLRDVEAADFALRAQCSATHMSRILRDKTFVQWDLFVWLVQEVGLPVAHAGFLLGHTRDASPELDAAAHAVIFRWIGGEHICRAQAPFRALSKHSDVRLAPGGREAARQRMFKGDTDTFPVPQGVAATARDLGLQPDGDA